MVRTYGMEDRVFDIVVNTMMVLLLFVTVYPLYFVLIASFSEPNLINTGQVLLLPKGITLEGFRRVFRNSEIWIGYRNTIFYTVFGTIINLSVTIPAAYALSRKTLVGRKVITKLFLFTMFFSGGLVPTYLLIRRLGMLNTVWVLLIPGAVSAYNVFVSRTFFSNAAFYELQDSASIDGSSPVKTFIRIILPLSAPIIAVMALFYGISHWNSYFEAMIYLSSRQKFPLQVFLREILILSYMGDFMTMTAEEADFIAQQQRISEMVKYVLIVVATLPVLLIYPFLQRFFIKGVMVGSIKG